MAEGAKRKSGSTYAISVTGYAGPAGGTDFDPVGTVYFGITGPDGTRVVRTRFGAGDRLRTRLLATQSALDLLRKTLLVSENQSEERRPERNSNGHRPEHFVIRQ